MLRTASALVLVIAAGCGSSTEPDARTAEVDFTLGVPRQSVEPRFVIASEPGAVQVRGFFLTPCQPYEAVARAEVDDAILTLHVVGDDDGECPMDVVQEIGYEARVSGLSGRIRSVRIVHSWPDTGWKTVVAHTATLQVP